MLAAAGTPRCALPLRSEGLSGTGLGILSCGGSRRGSAAAGRPAAAAASAAALGVGAALGAEAAHLRHRRPRRAPVRRTARCATATASACVARHAEGGRPSGGATQLFPAPGGGACLEVLGGSPATPAANCRAALLLVHGSYHAAWCWEPHLLEFFRSRGYSTFAISLRGQGNGTVEGEHPPVAGTLEVHAKDVADFVEHVSKECGLPVVVLGHSFGGLIAQRAVIDLLRQGSAAVAGLALLASVPPSGNGGLIWRYVWRDPLLAVQITWGFAARAFERDAELCRKLFFDADMPLADVEGYMLKMKEGCPEGTRLLDLRELQRSLPVPCAAPGELPVLVLGGDQDVIVDEEALQETAAAHGVSATILPGVAHDAMLGPRWQVTADAILAWLQEL